jgi:hypothetical protein
MLVKEEVATTNLPAITMEERFRILMEEGDQARAVEEAKIQNVIFLLRE